MISNRTKSFVALFTSLIFSISTAYFLSATLGNFVDEYTSIASINSYFKTLKLDAGFLGGPYSVELTSGPLSGVGFFISWEITKNLFLSRTSNLIFLIVVLFIFSLYLQKAGSRSDKIVSLSTLFVSSIFLIPWWYGILYSLGEITSTIFFVIAIFIYEKQKKMSMLLFGIAIFFGKIILLLPFLIIFVIELYYRKDRMKFFTESVFFLIPLFLFFIPVQFFYHNGNIINYIYDFMRLLFSHSGAGLQSLDTNVIEKIVSSEFSAWNLITRFRVLVSPILFYLFLFKNRKLINNLGHNLYLHIFSSSLVLYIWFWIISETKWIRYSQHFIVILVFSCLLILLDDRLKFDFLDYVFIILIIFPLLSNVFLIIFGLGAFIVSFFISNKNFDRQRFINIFIMLLILNSSIISFESYVGKIFKYEDGNETILDECIQNKTGEYCKLDYLGDI